MRSMQFGGKPIEVAPNRIYNCAYMPIDHLASFSECMFLLLGGTGVGFSVQSHHVDKLPEIQKPSSKRSRRYLVADSIEGWADAVKVLINSYFKGGNWKKVTEEASEFLEVPQNLNHVKTPDIRFFMAKAYLNQDLDDDAAYQLRMILDNANDSQQEDLKGWELKIGKEMGQVFIQKGKPGSAVKIYEGLVSRLPDILSHLTDAEKFAEEVDLYFQTAMLMEELKDNEKALEFYNRTIKLITSAGDEIPGSKEAEIRKFSEEQAKLLKWLIEMDSTPSQ